LPIQIALSSLQVRLCLSLQQGDDTACALSPNVPL
jgi:hypothetical protein